MWAIDRQDPYNGCTTSAVYTVASDTVELEIRSADIAIYDDTNCDASNPNGGVRISQIYVNGVATAVSANYQFTWTSLSAGSNTISTVGTAQDSINSLQAGTYTVHVDNTSDNLCESVPVTVVVPESLTYPLNELVSTSPSTLCSPATNTGTGQLQVSINGATALTDYTITWYRGASATGGSELYAAANAGSAAGDSTATGTTMRLDSLSTGDYTVVVELDSTGCSTTSTYNVGENLTIPSFNIATSRIVHDSLCVNGSGQVTITNADITIPSGATTSDFTWEYNSGSGFTNITPDGSGNIVLSSLDPDTITFRATYNNTNCVSNTVEAIIQDQSFEPVIRVDSLVNNTNCSGGSAGSGYLAVTAQEEDGDVESYTFTWRDASSNVVASTTPGAANTSAISNLSASGSPYTLTITNTGTSCSKTQSFTISDEPQNPVITSFSANNSTICTGSNANFELNSASLNGTNIDSAQLVNNYTLRVYSSLTDATNNTVANAVADRNTSNTELQIDSLTVTSGGSSTYYAVLTLDSTNCASTPVQFTVSDGPLNPIVQINVVQQDSTCTTSTTGLGLLVATADGQSDLSSDYTFNWYSGTSASGTVLASNDTIQNLTSGTYTVRSTNISSGCITDATVVIGNIPQSPKITAANTTIPTTCTGNGTITVTQVSVDINNVNTVANINRYNFAFYDTNPLSGTPTALQNSSSATFANGVPGTTYFAVGTDTLTGCSTDVYQVTMSEDSVTYPAILLADFQNQSNCDPSNPNGELGISIDGGSAISAYTVAWSDSNGTVLTATNPDSTTSTISGLTAGNYSVTVTNAATGCSSSLTFTIIDDVPIFQLSVSSSDNTFCVNSNGQVGAAVVPVLNGQTGTSVGFTRNAEFFWFIGDVENPDINNPDFTGEVVEGLPEGLYTVIARDLNDLFCISERNTVSVGDATVDPSFDINILSNLTICYPDQPNGLAEIVEDTLRSQYDFTWYAGTDTSGAIVSNGVSADSLTTGDYAILATDRATGCTTLQTIEILDETPIIADPEIIIFAGRTNCIIPNGHARATSSGLTDGILFEWYDADDLSTVLFTGEEISTLDTITYAVIATDLASGCISGFSEVTIPNEITDPTFTVVTTESLCLRTENGSVNQFSGQAFVAIEDLGVFVDSVTFFNSEGDIILAQGSAETLIDAAPGMYTVDFRASNGCDYSASFEIEANIRIYNGVSANNDGLNDFFLIDCLDFFPNNNVQIFNRDGVKVYEIDNYDNLINRFEGVSNVNGARNVPGGTYFYIIDKGDGSELIQGFLELVR